VRARLRRLTVLALLLTAVAAGAGCDAFAWILTKTIGPWVPEEESRAEYNLKGKSLLVLVDTKDPALASEFPRLQVALADAITKNLADHKACGPIVPSHSVEAARRAEPRFAEWSIAEVGKYFNVDLVLQVEVFEFRLKDNPASNVTRGYTEAAVRLVSPQTGDQVWPVLSAGRLIIAETVPGVEPEQPAEQETFLVDGFGDKIARQFYTYKLSDRPMRPKVK